MIRYVHQGEADYFAAEGDIGKEVHCGERVES